MMHMRGLDDWLLRGPEDDWETDELAEPVCPRCGCDSTVMATVTENTYGRVWSWDCPKCGRANVEED